MLRLGNYKVKIHHSVAERKSAAMLFNVDANVKTDEPLATSAIRCHPKDQFSKKEGTKKLITRLLKESNLSKEERSEMWEDYRLMTELPRW